MRGYMDFCFEVRDKRGVLQATFSRLWEAERYAEPYSWTVTKVDVVNCKPNKTVFKFNVYFESDKEFIQQRFVVAETEDEAIKKIEAYADDLRKNGFDSLVWLGCAPNVELEYVI